MDSFGKKIINFNIFFQGKNKIILQHFFSLDLFYFLMIFSSSHLYGQKSKEREIINLLRVISTHREREGERIQRKN
jgi:hypothetical protein